MTKTKTDKFETINVYRATFEVAVNGRVQARDHAPVTEQILTAKSFTDAVALAEAVRHSMLHVAANKLHGAVNKECVVRDVTLVFSNVLVDIGNWTLSDT